MVKVCPGCGDLSVEFDSSGNLWKCTWKKCGWQSSTMTGLKDQYEFDQPPAFYNWPKELNQPPETGYGYPGIR